MAFPQRFAMAALLLVATVAGAAPQQMAQAQARHLLLRTGFAPTQAEVERIAGRSAEAVVAELLAAARAAEPRHAPPDFVGMPAPVPYRLLASVEQRQEQRREQMLQGLELKRWWMREMVESPTPLRERMTLFWHNHFATSQQKVVRAQAMWQQHLLLRTQALGNFRSLLHAVAKDPAMLVYLDGVNSRKGAPNENFARELMELFTLGEASQGHAYTERDIQEAARAFTGWSVERDSFQFRYRPLLHDGGDKTVFGQSGPWDGDKVLDLVLAQPGAAGFMVSKLWREFVSPTPDPVQVQRIAARFVQSGFDIGGVVQDLLLSDAFWDEGNLGVLVKSPVELLVGTARQFELAPADTLPLVVLSAQFGQNLLVPPNVKGWPGYTDWINANSLLARRRFAAGLFQTAAQARRGMAGPTAQDAMAGDGRNGTDARPPGVWGFDVARWLSAYGAEIDKEPSDAARARISAAVLSAPASQTIAAGTVGVAFLRALTQDAAYQLK